MSASPTKTEEEAVGNNPSREETHKSGKQKERGGTPANTGGVDPFREDTHISEIGKGTSRERNSAWTGAMIKKR